MLNCWIAFTGATVPPPFTTLSIHRLGLLVPAVVLAACASVGTDPKPLAAFVVLGEDGAAVARVLTSAARCPAIVIDGHEQAMAVRAPAATIALRATASRPEDSKPSAFPLHSCEAALPAGARQASVAGAALALPKARLERIVVLGDTGCRMKKSGETFQPCNIAKEYPFAMVAAQAAAWQPDLVIHVGDYHYRENACPEGNAGCADNPWGYGWDAWNADFFAPGAPLLAAAPWVMARGNHESCNRGGQGFWRFLDPRPLLARRDCNLGTDDSTGDYSAPYAVPLGGDAQLIVADTSNAKQKGLKPGDEQWARFAADFHQMEALSARASYNIGVLHHPVLAFGAHLDDKGQRVLHFGDKSLIEAYGAASPSLLPSRLGMMLSGHAHLWEQLSFSSGHPTQFISGFSGTAEDIVPLPATLPPGTETAPGTILSHLSSWIDGFGYMTLERRGPDQWEAKVWDLEGKVRNTCQVRGRESHCALAQVPLALTP